MLEIQPNDSRSYFMLPQAPEYAGYYVYGTPINGAGVRAWIGHDDHFHVDIRAGAK